MAFGEHKAAIIAQAVEGPVTPAVAASFLQEHPHAQILLDAAAAAELTRSRAPGSWDRCAWDETLIRKAVIWLARKLGKAILKLTDEDYNEAGLQDLLASRGPAYDINLEVFRALQETITGWPGGKPEPKKRPGDIPRPTDAIFPKRVLIFSPHPDDDVISMGGTLIRLVDQGHEVHVAYQTSGNIAVFDLDAIRFADFAADFNRLFGIGITRTTESRLGSNATSKKFSSNKKPGQVDSPEVQQIKTLIRRGEARAAGRVAACPSRTSISSTCPSTRPAGPQKTAGRRGHPHHHRPAGAGPPHQIYAAGDLSDPHGTHRVCLAAVFQAVHRVKGTSLVRRPARSGSTAGPGRNGSRRGSRWPFR